MYCPLSCHSFKIQLILLLTQFDWSQIWDLGCWVNHWLVSRCLLLLFLFLFLLFIFLLLSGCENYWLLGWCLFITCLLLHLNFNFWFLWLFNLLFNLQFLHDRLHNFHFLFDRFRSSWLWLLLLCRSHLFFAWTLFLLFARLILTLTGRLLRLLFILSRACSIRTPCILYPRCFLSFLGTRVSIISNYNVSKIISLIIFIQLDVWLT